MLDERNEKTTQDQIKKEIAEVVKKYLTHTVINKDTITRCFDEIEELMARRSASGEYGFNMDELFIKHNEAYVDNHMHVGKKEYFISTPSEQGYFGSAENTPGVKIIPRGRSIRICVGDLPPTDLQLTKMVEILNNHRGENDFPITLIDPLLESEDEVLDRLKDVTTLCNKSTHDCPDRHSLANLITSIVEEPKNDTVEAPMELSKEVVESLKSSESVRASLRMYYETSMFISIATCDFGERDTSERHEGIVISANDPELFLPVPVGLGEGISSEQMCAFYGYPGGIPGSSGRCKTGDIKDLSMRLELAHPEANVVCVDSLTVMDEEDALRKKLKLGLLPYEAASYVSGTGCLEAYYKHKEECSSEYRFEDETFTNGITGKEQKVGHFRGGKHYYANLDGMGVKVGKRRAAKKLANKCKKLNRKRK